MEVLKGSMFSYFHQLLLMVLVILDVFRRCLWGFLMFLSFFKPKGQLELESQNFASVFLINLSLNSGGCNS